MKRERFRLGCILYDDTVILFYWASCTLELPAYRLEWFDHVSYDFNNTKLNFSDVKFPRNMTRDALSPVNIFPNRSRCVH